MWNDNETTTDLLGFDQYVEAAVSIIKTPRLLPTTIGIFGDWGSGKSSVMQMIKESLEKDEEYLCLYFNGWAFEGYDDARAALLDEIVSGIDDEKRFLEKAQDKLAKLRESVNWIRFLSVTAKTAFSVSLALSGQPNSTVVAPTAEELEGLVKKNSEVRQGIHKFRNDFAEVLAKTNLKALVIFIDDLDRCLPASVLEMLQVIRLFLSTPKTAFVIGADERLIRYAVSSRYPQIEASRADQISADIGRDYLEKLVQIAIHILPMSATETETYLNLLMAEAYLPPEPYSKLINGAETNRRNRLLEVAMNIGIARSILNEQAEEALNEFTAGCGIASNIATVLCTHLRGNPRQIKRFLNDLLIRYTMAQKRGTDLNLAILAKIMVLRYFYPTYFQMLFVWQASEANGIAAEIDELENLANETEQVVAAPPKSKSTSKLVKEDKQPNQWIENKELKSWLKQEPPLAGINLSPYFYFARQSVVAASPIARQLGQLGQEVVTRLLDESVALRREAGKKSQNLPEEEAITVLGQLARKFTEQDMQERANEAMLELVRNRPTLIPEYIVIVDRMPESSIPTDLPLDMVNLRQDFEQYKPQIDALFGKWKQSRDQKLVERVSEALEWDKK